MHLRFRWIATLLALVVLSQTVPLSSLAQEPSRIAPRVLQELEIHQHTPVFVVLNTQVDTSFANQLPTKAARGAAVVAALREQAAGEQAGLLSWLKSRGIAGRGFLSVNALSAEVDSATLQALALHPAVKSIDSDVPMQRIEALADAQPASVEAPEAIELGVSSVNAPAVWALGHRGEGIVIAGEDTGVRWTHVALKAHYRGWNGTTADHNYNWHDGVAAPGSSNPCGPTRLVVPCDDHSHGTHTVGTIVGDDGATNQIGVAPDAKWIACRNMDAGNGTISTYVDCIDWMLAPYPLSGTVADGDPAMAPDVINNSWGCPPSEGCENATLDDIQPSIQNAVNAGIMFVASAGNTGSGCQSIVDPPALYPESFTVGAYSPSSVPSNETIAGFSSRGPIVYNGTSRLGPDLSAPGVNTRSATKSSDSSYSSFSGTSMAGPHVVGVVALLWSARPELRGQVALTRRILTETATPTTQPAQTCGGVPGTESPNNTWGYGKINALAAVSTSLSGTITLNGIAAPSASVSITSPEGVVQPLVSASGTYSTTLPSGTYTVTATIVGQSQTQTVSIVKGQPMTLDFNFEGSAEYWTLFVPLLWRSE